jgi:hypothetical protein
MPRKSRIAVGHAGVEVEIMIPVRQNGRVKDTSKVPPKPEPPRIPRVARLMALAIKLQDMVDRGEVRDYADLARLGYVTRARMTQIMNLLVLAPDIQEEILGWSVGAGPVLIRTDREARTVISHPSWSRQREVWRQLGQPPPETA